MAEARPRSRDLALVVRLPPAVADEAVRRGRVLGMRGDRVAVRLPLRTPADVDEALREWLAAAYLAADDAPST